MIVIVASATDDEAGALAASSPSGVVTLTPLDLSSPGWEIELGSHEGTFVADGRRRHVSEISGILTRLVTIPATEMLVISPPDREYAACESTAFLAWWLGALQCPVINEPDPTSLVGRRLHPVEWAYVAEQLGVPFDPVLCRPRSRPLTPRDVTWCTMLDGEPTGPVPKAVADSARMLATQSSQRLCGFAFTNRDTKLCAVTPLPRLDDCAWRLVVEALR